MTSIQNTRRSQRTVPAEFAFIQICDDDGGKVLNVSDSGLAFESFAPLGRAKTLQFWFSLNRRDRVEAMGEIVWLDFETKIGGLRFVNPSRRVLEHIRRYSKGKPLNDDSRKGRLFAAALANQKPAGVPQSPATQWENPNSKGFDSTELISWQRHAEVSRKKFFHGLGLGLFVGSVFMAAAYRFWPQQHSGAVAASPSQPSSQPLASPSDSVFSSTPAQQVAPVRPSPIVASRIPSTSAGNESQTVSPARSLDPLLRDTSNLRLAHASATAQVQNSTKKAMSPQQLWSAVQVGDSAAAVVLADRYLRGDGVPPNCLQARVLLLVASEKKNAEAMKKLNELDKTGCASDPKQ